MSAPPSDDGIPSKNDVGRLLAEMEHIRATLDTVVSRLDSIEAVIPCISHGHTWVPGTGPGMYLTNTCSQCGKFEMY